jgi:hypothetical protein
MAQIINITSEALQATIRRLLPSQQGFGEDLQATNVVTPIIDLTPTAEGSVLPTGLQEALNFEGATAVACQNNTQTLANSPGFYRVTGGVVILAQSGTAQSVRFFMTDGSTFKTLWEQELVATGASTAPFTAVDFDKTFFLRAGDSLSVITSSVSRFDGSVRQVATPNGTLVNPVGFTFE